MKQWIIDRYNKNQKKYKAEPNKHIRDLIYIITTDQYIVLYDFLFNPKYGFAEAFWGDKKIPMLLTKQLVSSCKYHKAEMAISKDVLKYLEQFKKR